MSNDTKDGLKALKTRLFLDLGVRPDVMCSLLDSGESLGFCIETLINRCSQGENVSKKIFNKISNGYSAHEVRVAINKVLCGEYSHFNEAFMEWLST